MEKLKYFVMQLYTDNGKYYLKTAARTEEVAISNTMLVEGCPRSAIEIKEIEMVLFSMNGKHLFESINQN